MNVCIISYFSLIILYFSFISASNKKTYHGYSLWRATPQNEKGLQYLHNLLINNSSKLQVDFWHPPSKIGEATDILIGPNSLDDFLFNCKLFNIKLNSIIENLQSHIDAETNSKAFHPKLDARDDIHVFEFSNHYPNLDEVERYIKNLPYKYPGLVGWEYIATTVENRQIYVVKITNSATNNAAISKPAIWIDAAIHPREWIAPVSALYIIDTLLSGYRNDPNMTPYLDKLIWYIAPVANPDGYAYTHTIDRLWRKNRRPLTNCVDPDPDNCNGVDLNRNFGYHWGEIGSSGDPKTGVYRGPEPFSEPESRGIRDFIWAKQSDIKAYLSLHSSGQWWMYPYGYNWNTYSEDKEELAALAKKATDALHDVHGTWYTIGSPPDVIYSASGISADWVKGVAKVKYVYSIEMRPSGPDFILPPSHIVPTGEETWKAFKVIADEVLVTTG